MNTKRNWKKYKKIKQIQKKMITSMRKKINYYSTK